MPTKVRSYSKINLGLAIGGPREDGFHSLRTLYQTLALHDFVTVAARRVGGGTRIAIRSNDARVPTDSRNTVWKMVSAALEAAGVQAEVTVQIEKALPIQGGMGAGSANAAAALLGLERELGVGLGLGPGLGLTPERRMDVAARVGSDVPLFLVGGTVLGSDRGQVVEPVGSVTLGGCERIACVMALPRIGVSTPAAFREWDRRWSEEHVPNGLQETAVRDTIKELSRVYASCLLRGPSFGASGILPDSSALDVMGRYPENLQGFPHQQLDGRSLAESGDELEDDLAGNSLLALVRTGIENDFESVVFPQYPSLREIKRQLMGTPGDPGCAVYAALSGSGSALFGLYRSDEDAKAAQQRLQQHGVEALVTHTMPRPLYWSEMFAE